MIWFFFFGGRERERGRERGVGVGVGVGRRRRTASSPRPPLVLPVARPIRAAASANWRIRGSTVRREGARDQNKSIGAGRAGGEEKEKNRGPPPPSRARLLACAAPTNSPRPPPRYCRSPSSSRRGGGCPGAGGLVGCLCFGRRRWRRGVSCRVFFGRGAARRRTLVLCVQNLNRAHAPLRPRQPAASRAPPPSRRSVPPAGAAGARPARGRGR